MDMERENPAPEPVADNEAIENYCNLDNGGVIVSKIENNGCVAVEHVKKLSSPDVTGKAVQDAEPVNLTPVMVAKSFGSGSSTPSPGAATKGQGLRKWRRIRREVTKEGFLSVDNSKLLKRGLSNAGAQPGKFTPFLAETKQMNEGSVSSTNAVVQSPGAVLDGFAVGGESGLAMGPIFSPRTDSENSEDRSSKSSTAASVPKMMCDGPVTMPYGYDMNRMTSSSGKNLGSSVQKVQKGKIQGETSKKPRGERAKIEKENSHSSMESDSRSSNFLFMHANHHVTSNGRPNGVSLNYAGRIGDEALGILQDRDQLRTDSGRVNCGECEDVFQGDLKAASSWGGQEENSDNQGCSTDEDSLIVSIHMLQSVQEALEKEVEKFREIGKEDILVDDSSQDSCLPSDLISAGLGVKDPSTSGVDNVPLSLHALESEVIRLREQVHLMEIKLDETTAMLKVKEAKIDELKTRFDSTSTNGETWKLHLGDHLEMDSELEALFRQKIEAEVEHLTISQTIQNLKVVSVDEVFLFEQQIASEQSHILNKLGDAETKAMKLKSDAEKLEEYCEEVVSVDETVRLQSRVCKYTSYFFIQLILLVVILGLFISKLSPPSAGFVPT